MNNTLVTIAIPFYNDEKYLDFAIKSVFAQTYANWKLILMNDGGADNSLKIARRYEYDSRVMIYSDGENRKLPYRLNQIATLATTKYLARMDADDIMHPDRIATQLRMLEENPEIDVLGTNAYSIDENNNITMLRGVSSGDDEKKLYKVEGFIHPTIMAKTEWFKSNPYDEKAIRIEDFELWYRAKRSSIFMQINIPLLFYREFGGSYYKKYLKTAKSVPYIAFKHKSLFWILKYPEFVLKGVIYWICNLFGLEYKLIEKRGKPLSNKEKNKETVVLQSVMK